MKIQIGKSYKIVSLCGVAVEHMGCLGDIIKCTDINPSGDTVWFDGLRWTNFNDIGEYILSMSDDGCVTFGDNYMDFLNNVLEEVV